MLRGSHYVFREKLMDFGRAILGELSILTLGHVQQGPQFFHMTMVSSEAAAYEVHGRRKVPLSTRL
jgi:hypothetical protein